MDYFQKCVKGFDTSKQHSWVYSWVGTRWKYAGDGYEFEPEDMPTARLKAIVTNSGTTLSCGRGRGGFTSTQKNLLGGALAECGGDYGIIAETNYHRNVNDEGRCWSMDGKKAICIETLPKDFSWVTTQTTWSRNEHYNFKPRCLDIGMFSLYVARSGIESFDLQCDAIADHIFDLQYIKYWSIVNGKEGDPGQMVKGMNAIYNSCTGESEHMGYNSFSRSLPSEADILSIKENYCKLAVIPSIGNIRTTATFLKAKCFQAEGQWFLGRKGETCDQVCDIRGRQCDPERPATLDSHEKMRNAAADAGFICKQFGDDSPSSSDILDNSVADQTIETKVGYPLVDEETGECYMFDKILGQEDQESSCTQNDFPTRNPLCNCLVKQHFCFGAEGSDALWQHGQCNKERTLPVELTCEYDSNDPSIYTDDRAAMTLPEQVENDYILSWTMTLADTTSSVTKGQTGTIVQLLDEDGDICLELDTNWFRNIYEYCNELNSEHRFALLNSEGKKRGRKFFITCETKPTHVKEEDTSYMWDVPENCGGLKEINFGANYDATAAVAKCRLNGVFQDVILADYGHSTVKFAGTLRDVNQKRRLNRKKIAVKRNLQHRRRLNYMQETPMTTVLNMQRGEFVLGQPSHDCGRVCSDVGKSCDSGLQSTLTTNGLVAAAFKEAGHDCEGFLPARNVPGSPYADENGFCAPFAAGGDPSSCEGNAHANRRALCFCRSSDFHVGAQGATCHDTCAAISRNADPYIPSMLNTDLLVQAGFNLGDTHCDHYEDFSSAPEAPFFNPLEGLCAPFRPNSGLPDVSQNGNRQHMPLCVCTPKYEMGKAGQRCPPGTLIRSRIDCGDAFNKLGLKPGFDVSSMAWSNSNYWVHIGGCSTDSHKNFQFSTDFESPVRSVHRWQIPICYARNNNLPTCDSEDAVVVYDDGNQVHETIHARFGAWHEVLDAPALLSDPIDGCEEIQTDFTGRIAVIQRGNCEFREKIRNAQAKGARAVIILNNGEALSSPMMCTRGGYGDNCEDIIIPGVFLDLDGEPKQHFMNTLQDNPDHIMNIRCGDDNSHSSDSTGIKLFFILTFPVVFVKLKKYCKNSAKPSIYSIEKFTVASVSVEKKETKKE